MNPLPAAVTPLNKLVVIGVGLIGGSFALDLRRAGLVRHVVGVGRSQENLDRALQLQVIDEASTHVADAVAGADLVLLAVPVGQMAEVLAQIAPRLAPDAIVTDAGSTKRDVVALYREHLPMTLARCVPAHPIAGSNLSGAQAARFGLFERRNVVLSPLPQTSALAHERVARLWRACGANVIELAAEQHDAVFGTVSHLPHLLAFAYMNHVLAKHDAENCLRLAASGFRDFTRIAGSHAEMWRDIALANRDGLLEELDAYSDQIARMRAAVEAGDANALDALMLEASEVRLAWKEAG